MASCAVIQSVTAEFPTIAGMSGDTVVRPASMPHPRYLFGLGATTSHLYRMAENDTAWTKIYATVLNLNGFIWTFRNGVMLATSGSVGSNRLWRSINDGVSWTQVMGVGMGVTFSSTGYPTDWSFCEGHDGEGLLVEYGSGAESGQRAFLTTDYGATWTKVLDSQDLASADRWTHFHVVAWSSARDKWVVTVGDTTYARIFTLDRDGSNLTNLTPPPYSVQPVWMANWTDEEMVFGDDTASGQIAALNVYTGEARHLFRGWKTDSSQAFCWLVVKVQGLFYAFQLNAQSGVAIKNENVLLVAKNPEGPWVVAYEFDNTVMGGLSYAGFFDGKLHFRLNKSGAGVHWTIEPVKYHERYSTTAVPSRTNSEQVNIYASTALPWAGTNATLSIATGAGISGSNCMKATCDGTGAAPQVRRLWSGASIGAMTAGKMYQASVYIKPLHSRAMTIGCSMVQGTTQVGRNYFHLCPPGEWTRIWTRAHRCAAGVTMGSFWLACSAGENVAADPPSFLMDRVEVQQAPLSDWLAAQTSSTETELEAILPPRPKWTDAFYFTPTQSHWALLGERVCPTAGFCVRSWEVSGKYIELWFQPGIRATLAGSPSWDGVKSTVNVNESVLFSAMIGELSHTVYAAQNGNVSGKIQTVPSATQCTTNADMHWMTTNDDFVVEYPRFELRVDDGSNSESLYTQRLKFYANASMGFIVQVGGSADSKLRGWVLCNGDLYAFTPSTNDYSSFLNAKLTSQYGARSAETDRATGFPGEYARARSMGYVASTRVEARLARRNRLVNCVGVGL